MIGVSEKLAKMGSGVGEEYKHHSTILGDEITKEWAKEQENKRKHRERQHKLRIIHNIPDDIKKRPLSGVEKEQIMKGMSILNIYKRRMS